MSDTNNKRKVLIVEDDEDVIFNYLCLLIEGGFLPTGFEPHQKTLEHFMDAWSRGQLLILERNQQQIHFAATRITARGAIHEHDYALALFDHVLRKRTSEKIVAEFLKLNPESKVLLISRDVDYQRSCLKNLFIADGLDMDKLIGKRLVPSSKFNIDAIRAALGEPVTPKKGRKTNPKPLRAG